MSRNYGKWSGEPEQEPPYEGAPVEDMHVEKTAQLVVLRPEADASHYATTRSAGMDLTACTEQAVVIEPHGHVTVPSGVAVRLLEDQVALVFARSGLGIKHGIVLRNGTGVIDADYEGEIMICLENTSDEPYVLEPGTRVAQLVITRFHRFSNVHIKQVTRGDGGFGSTGTGR